MSIEVLTTVKFQPWQTPNFALLSQPPGRKEDGMKPLPPISLAELEAHVVDALAKAWLDELYFKVSRPCPFVVVNAK